MCTICGTQDGTTVLCHLNGQSFGKGMALKSDDIASFFGCYECHQRYDKPPREVENRIEDWEIIRAMYRTWTRLIETGVITIRGMK